MSILKKTLSFILSGAIAASTSISTLFTGNAAFTVSPDNTDSILKSNKGYYTSAIFLENTSLTLSYNYRKVAFDVWAKIDTRGFIGSTGGPENITTVLDEYLTGATAEFTNPDGSKVVAEILDFDQKQVDKFTLLFPRNGTYRFKIYTTSPFDTFDYELTLEDVNETIDKNDKTIPELTITYPLPTEYNGQKITITAKTNEICSIIMGDKVYSNCNYATFDIPCDGTYEVTAIDKNGNSRTKSFPIDYMDEYFATSTTTTATTKPTTTTTTKPTTTTTTTTIKPTTTTTITETTTNTATTTVTTEEPTTTATSTTITTEEPTTTATSTTVTTEEPTTTTATPTVTTEEPTTTAATTTVTTEEPTTTTTAPEVLKPTLLGDANCDGKVTIADAAAILQYLANPDKYSLSAQGKKNADVDAKLGITVSDALTIQLYDAKLIEELPYLD